jgi:death-on-curing protein
MKLQTIDVDFVILANRKICHIHGHKHICAHPEKIESALHAAMYPGSPPFVHGGVSEIAAAIFYYIIKSHAFFDGNKRTALICATAFVESNEYTLKYPKSKTRNDFADLAENCASNEIDLDAVKKWFRRHKSKIHNLI